jgi:hypothetical protein
MKLALNVMYVSGFMFFLIGLGGCANDHIQPNRGGPNPHTIEYRNEAVQLCVDDTVILAGDIGVDERVLANVYWMCLINEGQAL